MAFTHAIHTFEVPIAFTVTWNGDSAH